MEVALLTGDRQAVAAKVARQLGVREFVAELLPEQKLERVQQLIRSGKHVAMVGDGINDAPALRRQRSELRWVPAPISPVTALASSCWETIWLIAPNSWLSRGAAAALFCSISWGLSSWMRSVSHWRLSQFFHPC
jgi:phosphoserine phosphatase